jgi:broad specificity phosphatase PhoE
MLSCHAVQEYLKVTQLFDRILASFLVRAIDTIGIVARDLCRAWINLLRQGSHWLHTILPVWRLITD